MSRDTPPCAIERSSGFIFCSRKTKIYAKKKVQEDDVYLCQTNSDVVNSEPDGAELLCFLHPSGEGEKTWAEVPPGLSDRQLLRPRHQSCVRPAGQKQPACYR